MRRRWLLALAFVLGAECAADPDPYERQRARLEAQRTAADRAKAQIELARERERVRSELAREREETPEDIRRDLLSTYGPRLTPFQRSRLLTAPITSREEAEAMCRRWVEENERFR